MEELKSGPEQKVVKVGLKSEIENSKLANIPKAKPELLIGDLLGKNSSLVVKSKFLTQKQGSRKEFF